jgi:hypothetical protein
MYIYIYIECHEARVVVKLSTTLPFFHTCIPFSVANARRSCLRLLTIDGVRPAYALRGL